MLEYLKSDLYRMKGKLVLNHLLNIIEKMQDFDFWWRSD